MRWSVSRSRLGLNFPEAVSMIRPNMGTRSKLPLVLSAILLAGLVVSAWVKLRNWHGLPQVIGIFVCVAYVGWILVEARIAVRDSQAKSVGADRWTMELYAFSQGATVLSALLVKSQWPTVNYVCPAVGVVVFVLGAALRIAAVRALGAFYSHRVQVGGGHSIVDTGPYQWIRHPAYSGMLLAHLGFVLVFFNWVSLAVVSFALLPAIVRRITVEERALTAVAGYAEFCQQRARLVPLIW